MKDSQSISLFLGSIDLLSGAGALILLVSQIIMKWINQVPDESTSNYSHTPTPSKAASNARKIKLKP